MAEESILAKMRRADEMHMAAEENLRNARMILDEIATAMGFVRPNSRPEYPDVSGGGVPYPDLSESELAKRHVIPPAGTVKSITPAES